VIKQIVNFWNKSGGMLRTGAIMLAAVLVVFAIGQWIAPYGFDQIRGASGRFEELDPPSPEHFFGTTSQRFDVLSRTVLGFQPAVLTILFSIPIGLFIGILAGLAAGYFRGLVDRILSFVSDLLFTFPPLIVSMVISLGLSAGNANFFPAILAASVSTGLAYAAKYFRVVRAEVLQLSSAGFIQISRATGISNSRIIFGQVLPNSVKVLPVVMSRHAADAVLVLAGLGFLGLGISPEAGAEWGYDLSLAVTDIIAGVWWTALFPSLALLSLILGFSLIAEWLSDNRISTKAGDV
jgi:peptide/nickel transport system permease protein